MERTFELIPFPGDKGFALRNTETKQVSSVIPIGQRGITGARFADNTTVIVNIEAHDPSAVVVSLAEEEDFFPCPRCGGNHGDSKGAAIIVQGDTYHVGAIVRDGGIFGQGPRSLFAEFASMLKQGTEQAGGRQDESLAALKRARDAYFGLNPNDDGTGVEAQAETPDATNQTVVPAG